MPYIKQERRKVYDEDIKSILMKFRDAEYALSGGCAGDAAYVFYSLLQGLAHGGNGQLQFVKIARALGALEGAKAEFLGCDVAEYEAGKSAENGCVDRWCEALPQRGFEYRRGED